MTIWRPIHRFLAKLAAGGVESPDAGAAELGYLAPLDGIGLGALGRFRVMRLLGRGGMGAVLLAVDPDTEEHVALKVLHQHHASSMVARRRFERECKLAMSIHHDHVIRVEAIESSHDPPYSVMEYMAGGSLEDELAGHGPLCAARVGDLGMQIARGLMAIHEMGLVHSDLKPSNVLLSADRANARISDFGFARVVDASGSAKQRSVFATPSYASPEQVQGKRIDVRSDLFSLGSVLYAMCTGQPPFPGESSVAVIRDLCSRPPRPIGELNPEAPERLVGVINKLLDKLPAYRYQTAQEVLSALADAHGESTSRI